MYSNDNSAGLGKMFVVPVHASEDRVSSVGIATRYELDGPGIESR
jgi:hypothetical protein